MKLAVVAICLIVSIFAGMSCYLYDDFMGLQDIISKRSITAAQGLQ